MRATTVSAITSEADVRTSRLVIRVPTPRGVFCNATVAMIVLSCTAPAQSYAAFDVRAMASAPAQAVSTNAENGGVTIAPAASTPGTLVVERKWLLAQVDESSAGTVDTGRSAESTPPWGTQKSYAIPALEIFGFDTLLNLFDRVHYGCCDYNSNFSTIEHNLRSNWVVDSDTFTVNQIGHPYQGSMYHGFARASGLSYWESLGYTFVASAAWEIAGETTPPSRNDQVSTGIGGSFLGEALFRMSNLWLERSNLPKFWREAGAAAISPPVGFNRLAFGNRFDAIFPSNEPI